MKRTYEGVFVKVMNIVEDGKGQLKTVVYPCQGLTPDFARTVTGDFAIGLESYVYICTLELDLEKSNFYTVIFKKFHPNLPTKEDLDAVRKRIEAQINPSVAE